MVASLLGIKNSGITDDCVNYLRGLAPVDKMHYIYRGVSLEGMHNFQETQFEVWAPEEDTSDYYGPMLPLALGIDSRSVDTTKPTMVRPIPPAGVDAGAFYNLISLRKQGWMDNLLAIDQAANNTSVVFCLEWRNWKLLFPGDAELRSWKIMAREKMLRPVDLLKVGHHGSHNATPPEELFDLIMEKSPTHKRRAVVSTYDHTYSNVPDEEGTLARIKSRAELRDTRTLKEGEWFDFEF